MLPQGRCSFGHHAHPCGGQARPNPLTTRVGVVALVNDLGPTSEVSSLRSPPVLPFSSHSFPCPFLKTSSVSCSISPTPLPSPPLRPRRRPTPPPRPSLGTLRPLRSRSPLDRPIQSAPVLLCLPIPSACLPR